MSPTDDQKPNGPAAAGPQSAPQSGVNGTARRRLLTGGLAAAPVALTLVSRPVLGVVCVNASVVASAGSTNHAIATFCSGRTPEYWAKQANWPAPFVSGNEQATAPTPGTVVAQSTAQTSGTASKTEPTAFHCPLTGFNGTQFSNKSMMKVLQTRSGSGAHGDLAAYVVAAMLNARAGLTPVLDESRVRGIWNEYVSQGSFQPTTGVTWQPQQIIAWIKTTMDG